MSIHDWSRIFSGGFHHFHQMWTPELAKSLNSGVLPLGFYAAIEQVTGGPEPDVVTLESTHDRLRQTDFPSGDGAALAVAECPPQVQYSVEADEFKYARKADRVVVRHKSDDEPVAVIEIVSPGNKHSEWEFQRFRSKLESLMQNGVHLLVVDLIHPTPRDPVGFPVAFWGECQGRVPETTNEEPFTLTACRSDASPTGYFERLGVGAELPQMPLFLTPDRYVNVPLAVTYEAAWDGVPAEWKQIVEGKTS